MPHTWPMQLSAFAAMIFSTVVPSSRLSMYNFPFHILLTAVGAANWPKFVETTWVLDVSPGVRRTPGGPEEPRSTKAHYTCSPYTCTQSRPA